MNTVNKIKLMNDEILVGFNLVWPIGVTYPQYPGQKSPMDLWGEFSTWEPINYNGAFFRAAGGNANPWIEVITTNGVNFIIKEGRTVPLDSALKYGATVTFNGESRTVNNVVGSGSNITSFSVNSAFTEPSGGYKNITNVYILQGQLTDLPKHKHGYSNFSDDEASGQVGILIGNILRGTNGTLSAVDNAPGQLKVETSSGSPSIAGTTNLLYYHKHNHTFTIDDAEINNETRPYNGTMRIWRRIA